MEKDTFLFICSPTLGILDSWISVLYEIKKKKPDAKLIFYAHHNSTIRQIDLNAPLIKIASEIFDSIIYRDINDKYIEFNNFEAALKYSFILNHQNPWFFLKRVFNKLKIRRLSYLLNIVIAESYRLKFIDLDQLKMGNLKILYDIYESTKDYNKSILTRLSGVKKYSMLHGNNTHEYLLNSLELRPIAGRYPNDNTMVFSVSEKDAEYYQVFYGVKQECCRVAGIPRHEKRWIDFFLDKYCGQYEIPFNGDYVFLISRNYDFFIPKEEKIRYVREIYEQARKHNLKLVIKKHPDEVDDNSCEMALDQKDYGVTWLISNLHTFFLGKHSKFAVCFYSGVPSDMIQIGVPTIERLDSKYAFNLNRDMGIDLKDKNTGKNVTEYGYCNLVLVASTNEELELCVQRILKDFGAVMDELRSAYDVFFHTKENVNEYIANEIIGK